MFFSGTSGSASLFGKMLRGIDKNLFPVFRQTHDTLVMCLSGVKSCVIFLFLGKLPLCVIVVDDEL